MFPAAELPVPTTWGERASHALTPIHTQALLEEGTLSRGRTFWDRHDAEELEVQAGDRCLSDVLAQPLHRGQSEGNLIPVQDLQEANLQQEGWRKEAPSLTASPRAHAIYDPVGLCTCFLGDPRGFICPLHSSWSTPQAW